MNFLINGNEVKKERKIINIKYKRDVSKYGKWITKINKGNELKEIMKLIDKIK